MSKPYLSICIVTYNAWTYLEKCLISINTNGATLPIEVIVVDNHSSDDTSSKLLRDFPQINLIQNQANFGFTAPMNQALRAARGKYLLLLNPDSILSPNMLDTLVGFLDQHPDIGISSPMVLNSDGSFQYQCRRSANRPWDAFCYITGLSRLFPHSRRYAGYLMTYMNKDESHEVEAVSGSCMLIRREVIDKIGYLDEVFFAYQEDADFCFRARKAGWKIYYVPQAQMTHFGGFGGTRVHPFRSIYEWHRSYLLYYNKDLSQDYFPLFSWIYFFAIAIKLGFSLFLAIFKQDKHAGSKKPF